MHCYIYEISDAPIQEDDRCSSLDIPEWFVGSIADSLSEVENDERQQAIENFTERFDTHCVSQGEEFHFIGNVKESYFKRIFPEFQSAIKELEKVSFAEFSGQMTSHGFEAAMTKLKLSHEDSFDHYIYLKDEESLVTLDSWVRDLDLQQSYYFGGVIDYHW